MGCVRGASVVGAWVMRGPGRTITPLPAARALLAGAAILAGAMAPRAHAQPSPGEETAYAVPRPDSRGSGSGGAALPAPLPLSEAGRIRHVFALQRAGRMAEAAREAALLDPTVTGYGLELGRIMQGYILADRYLGPYTRPKAEELRDWLAQYQELADAPDIHALMLARLPAGAARPPAPASVMLSADLTPPSATAPVPEETEPVGDMPRRNPSLDHAVHEAAHAGRPGQVERLLGRRADAYAAQLRGEAGRILFSLNRDEDAYRVARPGAGDSGLAGQIAGLASWRLGRIDDAAAAFEAGWKAGLSTSALRSASAFWAARAHLRLRDPADYVPWMMRAAAERSTFYGMLARRTLGLDIGFGLQGRDAREVLTEADLAAVAAFPEGVRAFALLQVGQDRRAEAELRRLWPEVQSQPGLGRAIMLVAEQGGLVDLAAQLADLAQASDGRPRETMRFPLPHLRPEGGFRMDPAMVYGLARTESNFDADLVSSAGARGLMQIMPETARFVSGGGGAAGRLHDPAFNLALGQRYVLYLAGQAVDGDLLRLLASYNAGPNGFARMAAAIRDGGDPLMFIEAIPVEETRLFVPRVLAYTWIYAARMHLATPSLDELAAGAWPRFHAQDAIQSAYLGMN